MDGKGDIIDQANEAADIFRRSALSQRQPEAPAATGHCFNCDARMAAGQRWCDVACRTDWEKLQRAELMKAREPDAE